MLCSLWNDNSGGVITSELVLVASVTVGTLLAGLTSLRGGLVEEYAAVEQAIKSQSVATTIQPNQASNPESHLRYVHVYDSSLMDEDSR